MRLRSVLVLLSLAVPAGAGTVTGRITLAEKNGGSGDPSEVVVYLEGGKVKPKPASVTVTMKGKQFYPHTTVVPVGSTVAFPNEDPLFHNVFSISGDNRFDLDLYKRPKSGSWTFQHPGVVRVYCNIHPQMSAVLVVVDGGSFATPSRDGSYTIEGVPAGHYTLRLWHERAGEAEREIDVPEKGAAEATFSLDASKYKRVPHKNKFGKDYSGSETY